MTAYAIGTALARPTANVYKAIERLARLGAVLVEEGQSRVCRAVPIKEFLRHTERDFVARRREAEEVLGSLQQETFDERVYRIDSVGEALERARDMLARAKVVAVVDAFPRALDAVAPALEHAARRGVNVVAEAYAPVAIPGVDVVVLPDGQLTLDAWRSEQLNVVVDGREHLLALLSADLREVFQAVWSRSVYLSCLHHSGRMTEITLVRLLNHGGPAAEALRAHPFFRSSEVPGHRELVRRFTRPQPKERSSR